MYPPFHSLSIHCCLTIISPQKEHYLGLLIGNDNWWRTHGIDCRLVPVGGGSGAADGVTDQVVGSGAGTGGQEQWEESEYTSCLLSYTVIETVHAAIFMFLTVNHRYN